jgi:hypothetical protein
VTPADDGAADGDSGGQTVVLGWDGLDFHLADDYDLTDAFGEHASEIATFDNDALGKPHTYEVWPSIVTGVPPAEHGIRAKTADSGVDWADPKLALAARLASGVVPERVRAAVGRALRERGASLDFRTLEYYRERGVETVFDGRRALPLAVPNCRTDADDDLGVVFDRGAQLGEYLNVDDAGGGGTAHSPKVPVPRLEQRLVGEATRKLGVVRSAVQRDYDLVFVWLGFLDTVGHLAPTVEEAGWQARHYEIAAKLTRAVRADLGDHDHLVCVSDHGLQAGRHTHTAFFGSDDERLTASVDSVLDVKRALDVVTPRTGDRDGDPGVREAYRRAGHASRRDAEDVRSQLEDLGYL